jgi:hypothetical protein
VPALLSREAKFEVGTYYYRMNKLKTISLTVCLLLTLNLTARNPQSSRFINQPATGMMMQYGINYYDLPESVAYRPLLIGANLRFPLWQTSKNINMAIDLVPHVGFASTEQINREFGINVQFNTQVALSEHNLLAFIVGAGPHFVNVETERQAAGFLFSDNFLLAFRRKISGSSHDFELSFSAGHRHLSNASLQRPNGGIDNFMFGIGFARLF